MMIIAEIDGWTKEMEISSDAFHTGIANIQLFPPMQILAHNKEELHVPQPVVTTVALIFRGEYRNNLRVFKANI
jgi:hypothetical protein